ncbi:MAG: hypothetical protein R3F60_24195 [bacterium]
MKIVKFVLPVALLAGLTGCPREDETPLTGEEARAAVEEAQLASEAEALTAEQVEVGTDFTLGAGARKAAENIRDFYINQAPCADVTLEDRTVTIDFGVEEGCLWRGQTYHGQHAIEVEKAEDVGVLVHHTWTGFTNGRITVDGTASVTWSLTERSRHVEHDLTWSRDGKQAHGTGDRTQTLLDASAGLAGGILIEGERTWTGVNGKTWQLDIQAVEARPQDPIPQAGAYVLTNPAGKTLTMRFERVDAARIAVTLTGPGGREFSFVVRANGLVEGR